MPEIWPKTHSLRENKEREESSSRSVLSVTPYAVTLRSLKFQSKILRTFGTETLQKYNFYRKLYTKNAQNYIKQFYRCF